LIYLSIMMSCVALNKSKRSRRQTKWGLKLAEDTDSTEYSEVDWVAKCYQSRTTSLTDDSLDNCLVTVKFEADKKECFKCEEGYTYDEQ